MVLKECPYCHELPLLQYNKKGKYAFKCSFDCGQISRWTNSLDESAESWNHRCEEAECHIGDVDIHLSRNDFKIILRSLKVLVEVCQGEEDVYPICTLIEKLEEMTM